MSNNDPPDTGSAPPRWSEHHVEQLLGNLLRIGVLLSAAVVALGGTVYLWRHGGERTPDYIQFHSEPNDLQHVGTILVQAASPSGPGIIQLGVLLLIATPVARVAFAALAFWRSGDRLYVWVSLLVLALLLVSLSGIVAI